MKQEMHALRQRVRQIERQKKSTSLRGQDNIFSSSPCESVLELGVNNFIFKFDKNVSLVVLESGQLFSY